MTTQVNKVDSGTLMVHQKYLSQGANSISFEEARLQDSLEQGFHCCTNETYQGVSQFKFQLSMAQGNAVYGCGGFSMLNLASLKPCITRVRAFDISEQMQGLWEKIQKIMAASPLSMETATEQIKACLCEWDQNHLDHEIENAESFLSEEGRFNRIHKIFQSGHFSFTQLDLGNPDQFGAFLATQTKAGCIPIAVYISNCAEVRITGALSETDPARYNNFSRSLRMIPHSAVVIDAVTLEMGKPAPQRFHERQLKPTHREFYLEPIETIYKSGLDRNDYTLVRMALQNGVNPDVRDAQGYTDLMKMADKGYVNAMRALIECRADLEARDKKDGNLPLHYAAIAQSNQKAAIELLLDSKALIDAPDNVGMTALHQAVANAQPEAVETLLARGADRTAQDKLHFTPSMYLTYRKLSIGRMVGQPAHSKIKALLEAPAPATSPVAAPVTAPAKKPEDGKKP